MMTTVREDPNLLDALDLPPCPRCGSSLYEHDSELRAHICDSCGLYVEDDDNL